MPHKTIHKPDATPVTVTMHLSSARVASETLLDAYGIVSLYRELVPPGAERDATRRTAAALLRLSRWFGLLVDSAIAVKR